MYQEKPYTDFRKREIFKCLRTVCQSKTANTVDALDVFARTENYASRVVKHCPSSVVVSFLYNTNKIKSEADTEPRYRNVYRRNDFSKKRIRYGYER